MRIDELELINFRCFEKDSIRFAPRFTLLIGDNGSGKTAVLDALSVAIGSFLLGIPEAYSRSIQKEEMRRTTFLAGQTVTSELSGETTIRACGQVPGANQQSFLGQTWSRTLRGPRARTTRVDAAAIQSAAEELVSRVRRKEQITFPVLGYYGTGRLWTVLREVPIDSPGSRFLGYRECLNPASDSKRMFKWFKQNELAALQKKQSKDTLDAVRRAIVGMVPTASNCFWDVDWDELMITYSPQDKKEVLPFHFLSDGYRNVVGLVADIAYRMATLNPHLRSNVVEETPGVVLIDEIDLHLHPKWQRGIVDSFLKTFPKVQFIATSHSPFIIQSLYGRKDVSLWNLVEMKEEEIPSKSIEDIAEENQGVDIPQQSARFLEKEKVAEEYYRLLEEGKDADSSLLFTIKRRLDELIMPFSDDPAFHAFLKMERIAAGIDGGTN